MFAQPVQPPPQAQPKCRPGAIDENVADVSFPAGNERLMPLVAGRKKHREPERECGVRPIPRAAIAAHWLSSGAPDQPREHGVLGDVRRLPNDHLEVMDRFVRRAGIEPAQDVSVAAFGSIGMDSLGSL